MPALMMTMGPLFWVMVLFATLGLGVLFERLFYFYRININSGEFLRGLSTLLRSGQYEEALHQARKLPGSMARVVEAVLTRPKLARGEMRDIALEAASLEVYRVERNIRMLLVVSTIMPLLGILGTILGLVQFYEQPGITDGAATAPVVADTMHSVLTNSALGVALAIPFYLFYMYMADRARKAINSIERAGLESVHIICDARLAHRKADASASPKP